MRRLRLVRNQRHIILYTRRYSEWDKPSLNIRQFASMIREYYIVDYNNLQFFLTLVLSTPSVVAYMQRHMIGNSVRGLHLQDRVALCKVTEIGIADFPLFVVTVYLF